MAIVWTLEPLFKSCSVRKQTKALWVQIEYWIVWLVVGGSSAHILHTVGQLWYLFKKKKEKQTQNQKKTKNKTQNTKESFLLKPRHNCFFWNLEWEMHYGGARPGVSV